MAIAPLLPAQKPESPAEPTQEETDPLLDEALTPWTGDLDGI